MNSVWIAIMLVWGDTPFILGQPAIVRPHGPAVFVEREACLVELEKWKKDQPKIFERVTMPNGDQFIPQASCLKYTINK